MTANDQINAMDTEVDTEGTEDTVVAPETAESETQALTDASSGLDGLPVSLEIALPPIALTMNAVKSMTNGSMIPLGLDLSEPMSIGINGKKYGMGNFVQIGDKIGIQIEDWKPASTH